AVLDVLPLGLVIVDARGQFLMNNPALYRIWGADAPALQDLTSYHEYKGYWPNTRRRLKSKDWALARSLLHGEVVIGEEVDIEAFGGERKTILNSSAPIRDAYGTIIGGVAATLDITVHKQLEQALRASMAEACHRANEVDAILEATTDGVLLYNAQGQLIRTNAAARRLLAGDDELPEAWAQKTMAERIAPFVAHDLDGNVLSPERYPFVRIMHGEVLTGANIAEIETRRLDGSPITISVSGAPLYDEHGVLRGAVCVSRDVSVRMEIEKTLREREAMFRNTFDQAAVGMAHTALDGYWLRVNERMCAITGYSRKELLTRRFQDITHPDDVEANLSHARDLLAGKIQTYTMEKRYIRKNGSHIWVNLTVALAHTPPGAQRYFITVVEDITARKVLEQQRSDILSMVAHDLSNPLTVMKARLQLIRRQMTAGKTPEASVIKTAAGALTRMERLVGDLRDAASGDTHQLALKIAPYDVAALCRAEAEAQMQTNNGRHIDLILPAEPVIAEVDSDRITRLLGNLLSNAIKYSPPDQPITLSLECQFESPPNAPGRLVARIAVRDRGIGIAHDVLPHIFKRFYRAPGIHEEQLTQPSLGLGLYICRMLVEEHGGFIGTESTLGQGSTFFVTLPLAYPKESRS
ncbi:MAG: PAS domain S-box protein, partial [Ktedonobacterales bacterium]